LWVVAGIGLAVGAGFYYASVLACMMVLISLWILHKVEKKYLEGHKTHTLHIHIKDQPGSLGQISLLLEGKKIAIRKISMKEEALENGISVHMTLVIKVPQASLFVPIMEQVSQMPNVIMVTIE
jgi:putative Mg2+ transporter-C (MgtC) family protein